MIKSGTKLRNRYSSGYTVLELLSAMSLFAIVLSIIFVPMLQSMKLLKSASASEDIQSRIREVGRIMSRDIEQATKIELPNIEIQFPNQGPAFKHLILDLYIPNSDNQSNNFVNPYVNNRIDPTLKAPLTIPDRNGPSLKVIRYFVYPREIRNTYSTKGNKPNYATLFRTEIKKDDVTKFEPDKYVNQDLLTDNKVDVLTMHQDRLSPRIVFKIDTSQDENIGCKVEQCTVNTEDYKHEDFLSHLNLSHYTTIRDNYAKTDPYRRAYILNYLARTYNLFKSDKDFIPFQPNISLEKFIEESTDVESIKILPNSIKVIGPDQIPSIDNKISNSNKPSVPNALINSHQGNASQLHQLYNNPAPYRLVSNAPSYNEFQFCESAPYNDKFSSIEENNNFQIMPKELQELFNDYFKKNNLLIFSNITEENHRSIKKIEFSYQNVYSPTNAPTTFKEILNVEVGAHKNLKGGINMKNIGTYRNMYIIKNLNKQGVKNAG